MKRRSEIAALDLIEQAVAVLRAAPGRVWVAYYAGTLPFVLGLLYFWADMSRGAFAWQHCSAGALGVALLYIWMKSWQAVFAGAIHRQLLGTAAEPWTGARVGQLVVQQTLLQGTGLFVLPVTLVVMVPFGWCYAFYHNVSLYGDGGTPRVRDVARTAWRQACVWAMQNHTVNALLWFFGVIVFLNVLMGVIVLPWLVKMLLGMETAFTLSPLATFNTTFLAVVAGLTFLCVNPLTKTVYILRCFYGESRQSGADLRAALRAAVVFCFLCLIPAHAETEPSPELPAQLDSSIEQTLNQPEYTWRLPREAEPEASADKNFIARFVEWLRKKLAATFKAINRIVSRIIEWIIRHLLPKPKDSNPSSLRSWEQALRVLTYLLIGVVLVALVWLIVVAWKRRQPKVVAALAVPDLRAINVADENILASQLPGDSWLEKARELAATGDYRLALRALYLASLAYLGQIGRAHV